MRCVLGIALTLCACTAINPAFDPDDLDSVDDDGADDSDAWCEPAEPIDLVAFDFDPPLCSAPFVRAGMIVTQDAGAFTMVECAGDCPCSPDQPALGIALHPDIPIPVFSQCILLRSELDSDDCAPTNVTIRGFDGRLLVHAEHWGPTLNTTGLIVSKSLVRECECEACDADSIQPGTYGMTFASPDDEVGPLVAGEMAEMTMRDDAGAATYVVKALTTAVDCDCSRRRGLQWSVTRG